MSPGTPRTSGIHQLLGERQARTLPSNFHRDRGPCWYIGFGLLASRLWGNKALLFLTTQLVVLCFSSPWKQMQHPAILGWLVNNLTLLPSSQLLGKISGLKGSGHLLISALAKWNSAMSLGLQMDPVFVRLTIRDYFFLMIWLQS